MNVTIRDVAARAGVSISTVSRVLNGSSPVSEAKRKLVEEAADTLGYRPNPAALSLLGKRTGALGVLLPYVSGEFFSELLGGLDEAAQEAERFLLVSTSHSRSDDFRRAAQIMKQRVDGLIVMAPEIGAAEATTFAATDAPVVFLNTGADPNVRAAVVNFDNHGGGRMATEHLLGLGHRHVAFVRGPEGAWDASERARGFRDAMDAAGLLAQAVELDGGYTREAGYAAAAALLELHPRPTAVVTANDYCALGLSSALHESGVSMPEEMSIVGFDGLPSGAFAMPPLTTVHVPIRELGSRAVRLLLSEPGPDSTAATYDVLPVELVVRASTAPPPP